MKTELSIHRASQRLILLHNRRLVNFLKLMELWRRQRLLQLLTTLPQLRNLFCCFWQIGVHVGLRKLTPLDFGTLCILRAAG